MKDRLQQTDWTSLIPNPRPDWGRNLRKIPIVKLTYPDSYETYAITTPVTRGEDGVKKTSLYFELGGERGHRMMDVTLDELRAGEFKLFAEGKGGFEAPDIKVEFVGLAGDRNHQGKRWSYLSP